MKKYNPKVLPTLLEKMPGVKEVKEVSISIKLITPPHPNSLVQAFEAKQVGLPLEAYMIEPVQRIPRYILFLNVSFLSFVPLKNESYLIQYLKI